MKDWKGNQIKVGQTVVKYAVKQMFADVETEFGFINRNREYKSFGRSENKREYLWLKTFEANIVEGQTAILSDSESIGEIPISMIDIFLYPKPHEVITIKGISDNKEDYYLHEFNS